jgi:pimeloyl-ACP methyl ester carboxylesterase
MNRRNLLQASAAAALTALAGCASTSRGGPKAPFVLVHGAWHGGWCWDRVKPHLEAAGHMVYTPTLAGLAERAGELSAAINLDTHVRDVITVLERNDLHGVILVGHSYAGMVIPQVADRMPQRLKRMVFLDALLLENNMSFKSSVPTDAWAARIKQAQEKGRGIGFPAFPAAAFGIPDKADQAWVESKLTLHPVGTYEQPMVLKHPFGNGIDKVYVDCTDPIMAPVNASRNKARAQPGWKYDAIATGHDAMVTKPRELAELFMRYA